MEVIILISSRTLIWHGSVIDINRYYWL